MTQKAAKSSGVQKRRRWPVDLDLEIKSHVSAIAGALNMTVPEFVNAELRRAIKTHAPRVAEQMSAASK